MAVRKTPAKRTATRTTTTRKTTTKSTPVAKNYRLLHMQPLQFVLSVGHGKPLLYFDEKIKRQRAIRHCPAERSIFVDEQSDGSVVEPIIFLKGLLETKPTDVATQEFLDAHPKNGTLFELIDNVADASIIADEEEVKIDVKQAIRAKSKEDAGIEELRLITSVLISDAAKAAKLTIPELKNTLYNLVDENVGRFVDEDGEISIFDDVDIQRAAITQHAFNSGVIQVSADGGKIMWSDNKATICSIPVGQSHVDFFSKYLGTEEGLQVAVEISKR